MKKVLAFILAGCLIVLAPLASYATVKSFTRFSVDVPQGWEASEDGNVVALLAPGHAAAVSIAVDSAQDMSAADLAKAMSTQLKGSAPVQGDDGGYGFTFKNPAGVESQSMLYVEKNEYILVTITGDHPDIANILDSIEEK